MPIQILSDQTVAQIAAGEVVERPASAVKELMENALDAGATLVHVAIEGGGRKRIRISDNGSGIFSSEVELAFARHATSKLAVIDDLSHIRTLGFRGEALSSIASVSRLSVTTRHREEATGTQMRIEGSTIVQKQSVGAPAGTVIDIENLFFNTPARLKFLKKETTEKHHIAAIVTRYALAYPEVRFVLEQDGRELLRTSGSGQLADVLAKVLGLDRFRQMVEVSLDDEGRDQRPAIRVFGYTSTPDHSRADRTHITLFVNGRHVQNTKLTYAVIQAYHTLLMTKRFPVAVLMIEIAPEEVDVNVHPTKAEVRFRDPDAVFSVIQRAVRQAVIVFSSTPAMRSGRFEATQPPIPRWGGEKEQSEQLGLDLPLEGTGQYPGHQSTAISDESREDDEDDFSEIDLRGIPEGPGSPANPRTLPMLRVIGQVGAMYIVAEGPAGMYLVDQHAAHERILYEQFMEEYAKKEVITQHTLSAQTIDFSPAEMQLVEEHLDRLKAVGFVLEAFGPNTFTVRAVPGMLAESDPIEVVASILDDLSQGKQPGQKAIEEKLIMRVCRHAAVKAGQVLSLEEMRGLIRKLERCRSPHTCPHGRPTVIHMSSDQLAREFRRM